MGNEISIIPLGVGGYIPNTLHETTSVLVRCEDIAILFDAGTGVSRLLDPACHESLDGVQELNLFLSHYHLDHVIGITWLLKVWQGVLRIHAPSWPLVNTTGQEALAKLTEPPLFGVPLAQFPFPTEIYPFTDESRISLAGLDVDVIQQTHPGGSVGFRIDHRFAYITDTDPDERHVKFLQTVDLLLMDSMFDMADYREGGGSETQKLDHGSSRGVAEIARRAGVKRLGLIHINPSYDEARCLRMLDEARPAFDQVFVPEEGISLTA